MNNQFMILAHRVFEGREEMLVSESGQHVSIDKVTDTGLVDADGNSILRIHNPIGFHKAG